MPPNPMQTTCDCQASSLAARRLEERDGVDRRVAGRGLPALRDEEGWLLGVLGLAHVCTRPRRRLGVGGRLATGLPGDIGFDPLGLKPEDPAAFFEMQEKEINNGRLAMIAAAGFLAQEAVTGQTWGTYWGLPDF